MYSDNLVYFLYLNMEIKGGAEKKIFWENFISELKLYRLVKTIWKTLFKSD